MKSPFPGMDPYLEAHWRDVHARLILYACDQLETQLPANLIARVEERVVVEPEDGDGRDIYPDVRVVEHERPEEGFSNLQVGVAISEPVVVHFETETATETFLQILETHPKQRLITVLEILSPTNKIPGEGQNQYRQKQIELRQASVSLVEIDLLRTGKRVLSLPAARVPRKVRATYQMCVRRGWKPHDYEIYAASLRQRLPLMRVPLREKDEDARLDLQALVDLAYRKGRYYSTLDYHQPPEPPLDDVDRAWARSLLRQGKKRSG
jgi:hypothetical protein